MFFFINQYKKTKTKKKNVNKLSVIIIAILKYEYNIIINLQNIENELVLYSAVVIKSDAWTLNLTTSPIFR